MLLKERQLECDRVSERECVCKREREERESTREREVRVGDE